MSPQDHEPRAGREVATVAELVELIILNLDYFDVLRAKGVSSFWRNVITNSPKLLRKMHKLPVLIDNGVDEDPHFAKPSVAAENALIQHDVDAGKPVVQEAKNAVKVHLQGIHKDMTAEALNTHKSRLSVLSFRYRLGCRGIRTRRNGWPAGYRETYCKICNSFHTKFRFQNIHPLLRSLDDMEICFRGDGPLLLFTVRTLYSVKAPRSCQEHVCADFVRLAKLLRETYAIMQRRNLQEDIFMQPSCVRLVGDVWPHIADNAHGVTLKEALVVMMQILQSELLYQGQEMLERRDQPCRGWESESFEMQDEQAAYFGSAERWEAHVADFPNIVAMFDEAVAEVGRMFEGIVDRNHED